MKNLFLSLAIVLLAGGVVYGFVAMRYAGDIANADSEIEAKRIELAGLMSNQPEKTRSPQPAVSPEIGGVELFYQSCFKCHAKSQVASFHYPQNIKLIEEDAGREVWICTTCHGEPAMFVHFPLIQEGLKCEVCHIREGVGGFIVPEKKEGDLLICQLCHARGNYITIHIDGKILDEAEIDERWITKREGFECTLCHNEELYQGRDLLEIHREHTADLGRL